jgi:acyl dehydratase
MTEVYLTHGSIFSAIEVVKEGNVADLSADASSTDLYFEDHVPGSVYLFGSVLVEEQEIRDFATRYDPQVFHTDPEAAKQTSFGGLIASGWHTAALAMRLIVDHRVARVKNLGSPGVDELRWVKPVRPGDTLSVRVTILEAKLSQSKPDRGVVKALVEVLNQTGEVVTSWKGFNIVLCRTAGSQGL